LLPDLNLSTEQFFGYSVGIKNGRVVIGSPGDDSYGNDVGLAYVYDYSGGPWNKKSNISASVYVVNGGDYFGSSVSVDKAYVAVGAPKIKIGVNEKAGAVYVFRRSGDFDGELFRTESTREKDYFGQAVSVKGTYLLVGAPRDGVGAAYIYKRNAAGSWIEQKKLIPSRETHGNPYFGNSVSIDGSTAVVGMPYGNWGKGVVYIY